MKALNFTIVAATIITLASCGWSIDNEPVNTEVFRSIEQEMKNKFGDDAYYTDVTITYNKSIGNSIQVTVTDDSDSLKMGQWKLAQGTWIKRSEVSLEVPEGNKATDFMFQLNEKINLIKLGELVEKSSNKLKNLENVVLHMALIRYPKNGDMGKTEYTVILKPENRGTTFTFMYTLNGELIKMDY